MKNNRKNVKVVKAKYLLKSLPTVLKNKIVLTVSCDDGLLQTLVENLNEAAPVRVGMSLLLNHIIVALKKTKKSAGTRMVTATGFIYGVDVEVRK